jgi:hypothetical protein
MSIEERLHEALHRVAEQVNPEPPARRSGATVQMAEYVEIAGLRSRMRGLAVVALAAVLVLVVAGVAVLLGRNRTSDRVVSINAPTIESVPITSSSTSQEPTTSLSPDGPPSGPPPPGPPQVDLGSFYDQDALIAALQASGPLNNEDTAANVEGLASGLSICADIMANSDPEAGEVVHQVGASMNGDGGVVFVLRHGDGTQSVRMYSAGDADPATGGCRMLFDVPFLPTPASAPPERPWQERVADLLQTSRTIVADHPGVLAADAGGGDWLLINTSTNASVTAQAVGNIIGVGDLGDDFLIVTNAGDSETLVNVQSVSLDGTVRALGSIDTPSYYGSPPRAVVGLHDNVAYVLVQTATNVTQSIGNLAVVFHGTVERRAPTIYGALTFTDEGHLIVSGGNLGTQRQISTDMGGTWTDSSLHANDFAETSIVMSLDADTELAYETADPSRLGIVHSDGSLSNEFSGASDGGGWFVMPATDPRQLLLVGRLTGQSIPLDRTTGTPTGASGPTFPTDGGIVMTAWPTADGTYQALVGHGPHCQPDGRNVVGDCPSVTIVDGSS